MPHPTTNRTQASHFPEQHDTLRLPARWEAPSPKKIEPSAVLSPSRPPSPGLTHSDRDSRQVSSINMNEDLLDTLLEGPPVPPPDNKHQHFNPHDAIAAGAWDIL